MTKEKFASVIDNCLYNLDVYTLILKIDSQEFKKYLKYNKNINLKNLVDIIEDYLDEDEFTDEYANEIYNSCKLRTEYGKKCIILNDNLENFIKLYEEYTLS